MPDELEIIKALWLKWSVTDFEQDVEMSLPTQKQAVKDIHYLINRLEAAEKAARGIAMMHGHKLKDRENDWK